MRFPATILSLLCFSGSETLANKTRRLKKSKKHKASLPFAPKTRLEKVYGPLISDEELDQWVTLDDTITYSGGLSGLPAMRTNPTIDRFSIENSFGFSRDDYIKICLTKCQNNDNCEYVGFEEIRGAEGLDDTGFFACRFLNPAFGPFFVSSTLETDPRLVDKKVFFRKGTMMPPLYDNFACDVPSTNDDLQLAIGCALGQAPAEVDCNALLTADFMTYQAPALQCVVQAAGPSAVEACLQCGTEAINGRADGSSIGGADFCDTQVTRTCQTSSTSPGESILGPGGLCEEDCPFECATEIQQFILCRGSAKNAPDECVNFGIPGLPPFTCPDESFVAPTEEEFLELFFNIM